MPVRHLETPDRYLGPRIKFLYHAFNRKFMETARANGVEELTSMHGRILGYLYWSRPKDVYRKILRNTLTSPVPLWRAS